MKYKSIAPSFSRWQRCLILLNIATQVVFPLAVAFTPVMARAGSDTHFLHLVAQHPVIRTQVYTLSSGESVASVAKKYHISMVALRKLNQLRTFAHGFNHLLPGDELDVPMSPLPAVTWEKDKSGMAPLSGAGRSDKEVQKVASVASQAGSFLANSPNSDAAASIARGMATEVASGKLQQWMSRFGTARVQLGADNHFSLKNSQFDLLVPLYDQGENLIFTQGSLHRTDDRTQANLGTGWRHFMPGYMVGGNLFGDYDLSRAHARMGAGLEYWRDFLKLGVNGYMRLTGWKDSPDLVDYEERPANGWDVRAQAWLPLLPQLGGKLTYEQYYGNEVGLFGVDDRQKNPHAITAGINYTPVPLITLDVEQRQEQREKSDTLFGVDMNYQLGVPWRRQMDPAAVATMRNLAGSRYDLVERNNNIVLEYRKKEMIRLHTMNLVTGHAGEQKSLGVSVTSKYGLAHIDWVKSSLVAAGGNIVQNGGDYAVLLPPWRTAAGSINTYTVSGVAVDTKGNRSERSETQVTVLASDVNKQYSTFTPANSTIPADGKSTQVLTLTLKDNNNNPVDLMVRDIILKHGNLKSATVSALMRKSAGVYTATVKAGTDIEAVTLTPSVQGVMLSPDTVNINSIAPDATKSTFSASPTTLAADNEHFSTLIFTAQDRSGNAITGIADNLTLAAKNRAGQVPAAGTLTVTRLVAGSTPGSYTATLRGTQAAVWTVTPQFNGSPVGSLKDTVTLTAGTTPDGTKSTFAASPQSIPANNDTASLLTFTAQDHNGNAISGIADRLTLAVTNSAGQAPAAGTLTVTRLVAGSTPGSYTATLRGTQAAVWTVTPQFNGSPVGSLKDTVTLTAGTTPDGTKSTFAASPQSIPANNDTASLLTFTAQDHNGNAISGIADRLTLAVTNSAGQAPAAGTLTVTRLVAGSTPGSYTATLRGTQAAVWTVTPQFNNSPVGSLKDTVTLTAGAPAQATSAIATDHNTYVAGSEMTVMVTLKDAAGNPLIGQVALLTPAAVQVPNATLKTAWVARGDDGTYIATYTATTAGTGLKAALSMAGWQQTDASAPYTITAGTTPDATQSTFAASQPSIPADNTTIATLTFTAMDGHGNAIPGLTDKLSLALKNRAGQTPTRGVTVSAFSEGTPGTYTATLKGTQAETYTLVPQVNGSAVGSLMATVTLTAGAPVQATSTIATDTTTYTAGSDMTITVALKDAVGNTVKGQSALLTPTAVQVAHATLKSGSNWHDGNDGSYSATYTATAAGTGLKATLKLAGWGQPAASEAYAITADNAPDATKSIFIVNPYTIPADNKTTALLTFMVKDGYGNTITGLADRLTLAVKNSTGQVPAAGTVTVTRLVAGTAPGSYTATLKGTQAAVWTVTPQFNNSPVGSLAVTVTLTANIISSTMTHIALDSNRSVSYTPLSSTGGTAPYTYNTVSGGFPPGVNMSSGGAITGKATGKGSFTSVTIDSTDVNGLKSSNSVTMSLAVISAGVLRVGTGLYVTDRGCLTDGISTTDYSRSCVTYSLTRPNLGFVANNTYFDVGFGGDPVVLKGAQLAGYWRQMSGTMGLWQLEGCSDLTCNNAVPLTTPRDYHLGQVFMSNNTMGYPAYRFRFVGGTPTPSGGGGFGSITELTPIYP